MNSRQQDLKRFQCLKKNRFFMVVIMMLLLIGCVGPGTKTSVLLPTASITRTPPPTLADTTVSIQISTQLPTTTPSNETALEIVPPENVSVDRYGLLELDIQTSLQAANPYDPNEIDLRVRFTAPSGRGVEAGAFWYQGYDLQTRLPKGEPGWRARFTPTETGAWSAVARIPSRGLESAAVSFHVVESDNTGYVRVHPSNPRYFAFDDGSFFFPIGLNIAWWSGAGDALTDYRKWMDAFSATGGNTIRVWMAEWSFGIEWNDTLLGDYDNRLKRAWLLDQIFTMAAKRDIYVVLVLLNCADFNNWQTNGWNGNPYNSARGGPLRSPDQFVTDPTARTLLQRRLDYIVNRWGYSPHLLAWEWWNEVNLTPFTDETLIPWLQEMSAYLRERDVNRHLMTNSYAIRDISPIWDLPEMEIIQKHEYAHQVDSINKDLADRAAADFTRLAMSAPAKPILLGEFGYGDEGYGNEVDKTGIHLHNGIWATTFAGYAGSGMYWFWDVYVEAYRVWYHFRGLNRFLEGVDLAQYQPFSPLEITTLGGDSSQALGMGLRGEDILIWLRSDAYTVQASEAAQSGNQGSSNYLPPTLEGLYLTLNEMDDGEYTVNWYDPQTARWMDMAIVTAQNQSLTIPIPSFRYDLAAKVIRNP